MPNERTGKQGGDFHTEKEGVNETPPLRQLCWKHWALFQPYALLESRLGCRVRIPVPIFRACSHYYSRPFRFQNMGLGVCGMRCMFWETTPMAWPISDRSTQVRLGLDTLIRDTSRSSRNHTSANYRKNIGSLVQSRSATTGPGKVGLVPSLLGWWRARRLMEPSVQGPYLTVPGSFETGKANKPGGRKCLELIAVPCYALPLLEQALRGK
jgi:hypothetical protein